VLEALHLTKFYGTVPALRNVSFAIGAGTVLGLLGPNGSGKSSTVGILTGLLVPSSGSVCLDGIDIRNDLDEYKARLGYVPEEPLLYMHLTGPEYLTLVGRLRGMSERTIRRRTDRLIEIFGLTDARHTQMAAYSKGMRQKVLLSAALLHDPRILILDEPDSGLDVTSSLVLRSLVQALAADGRLVVYSSHVLALVEHVATTVLILQNGITVGYGSVSELRTMVRQPSLEMVFRQVVTEQDSVGIARDLIDAMRA
jgi:ABC-2 type transport system ATP-binding protein